MRLGFALLALSALLTPGLAHAQPDGAWFAYHSERRFVGQSGAYAGWSDELVASGRYAIQLEAEGADAHVHGSYQWRYTSPESRETGSEDRTVTVRRADRHYTERTDLDEYDAADASTLATWVFVPTTLAIGDRVEILDETFEVMDTHAALDAAGAPRSALLVEASGTGARHDAYGDFRTRWTDQYWFDAATGMFLRELRVEDDVGTTEGAAASLRVTEDVRVFDASYAPIVGAPPVDPLLERPRSASSASMPLVPVGLAAGGLMLVVFLLLRGRKRGTGPLEIGGTPVTTRQLGAQETLGAIDEQASVTFAPLVPHFVAVARGTGDAVWIAELGGKIIGVAIDDAASGVATIFAREPDVCELLRKRVARQDFFAELRHGNLATVITATSETGTRLPAGAAYNVLETYEVLTLERPGSPAYDTAVVTRMTDADVPAAAKVLGTVLGTQGDTYLRASLKSGDLAYVARVDGAIVGIGLATVVGALGRLHTLAVDPAHRNEGLGRELVRARIRAMAALGATRIVTEISALNSASLEIARGEGFTTTGTMYIETTRDTASSVATTPTVRR